MFIRSWVRWALNSGSKWHHHLLLPAWWLSSKVVWPRVYCRAACGKLLKNAPQPTWWKYWMNNVQPQTPKNTLFHIHCYKITIVWFQGRDEGLKTLTKDASESEPLLIVFHIMTWTRWGLSPRLVHFSLYCSKLDAQRWLTNGHKPGKLCVLCFGSAL